MEDSEHILEITLEVEIVTDTEDSLPEFSQEIYSFSLREDAPDGTEIGDVDASDEGHYGNTSSKKMCFISETEEI